MTTTIILLITVFCIVAGCFDYSDDSQSSNTKKRRKSQDKRVRRSNGQIARKIPVKNHTGVIDHIYI